LEEIPLLTIRCITKENDFLSLEPGWNELLESSGSNTVFLTFEWVSVWWSVFRKGKTLLILLVYDGQDLIGIAPLCISMSPFRKIEIIGGSLADYQDFIILRNPQECMSAIFEYIYEKVSGWDFLGITRIPSDSPNHQFFRAEVEHRKRHFKYDDYKIAPFLRIDGDWDRYYATLKGHFRRNLRMRLRRLQSMGYEVKKCATDNQIEDFIDAFFKLKTEQYKRKGAANILRNRLVREFFGRVARVLHNQKFVDCSYLEVQNGTRAVHFGIVYGHKYYSYLTAFDSRYRSYGVGRILQLHVLRHCFEDGLNEFDFLVGAETYKFDWNPSVRRLYRLYGFKDNLRGEMHQHWLWHVKPALLSLMPRPMIRQMKRSIVALGAALRNLRH
jgi:CelD/BcsL family acetyltransferase involved in cellulose biosynthesis